MERIILVRHGETTWNRAGVYQGQADAPLSPLGRRQAQRVGERLAREPLAAVYASDLRRARDTAEEIARHHGLPVQTDPDLREMRAGIFEGRTWTEILTSYRSTWESYRRDPEHTPIAPGGESYGAFADRVVRAVERVRERHPGETVAVVAHGGTVRALLCRLLHIPVTERGRLRCDNAGITVVTFREEGPELTVLNDTCHLAGLSSGEDEAP